MAEEEKSKEEVKEEVVEEEATEEEAATPEPVTEEAPAELDVNNEIMEFLTDLKGLVLNMQETIDKIAPQPQTQTETVETPAEEAPAEAPVEDSPVEAVEELDDMLHPN